MQSTPDTPNDEARPESGREPGVDAHSETGGAVQTGELSDSPTSPREYGGRKGPDPVRYGDWEKNGRCIDF